MRDTSADCGGLSYVRLLWTLLSTQPPAAELLLVLPPPHVPVVRARDCRRGIPRWHRAGRDPRLAKVRSSRGRCGDAARTGISARKDRDVWANVQPGVRQMEGEPRGFGRELHHDRSAWGVAEEELWCGLKSTSLIAQGTALVGWWGLEAGGLCGSSVGSTTHTVGVLVLFWRVVRLGFPYRNPVQP